MSNQNQFANLPTNGAGLNLKTQVRPKRQQKSQPKRQQQQQQQQSSNVFATPHIAPTPQDHFDTPHITRQDVEYDFNEMQPHIQSTLLKAKTQTEKPVPIQQPIKQQQQSRPTINPIDTNRLVPSSLRNNTPNQQETYYEQQYAKNNNNNSKPTEQWTAQLPSDGTCVIEVHDQQTTVGSLLFNENQYSQWNQGRRMLDKLCISKNTLSNAVTRRKYRKILQQKQPGFMQQLAQSFSQAVFGTTGLLDTNGNLHIDRRSMDFEDAYHHDEKLAQEQYDYDNGLYQYDSSTGNYYIDENISHFQSQLTDDDMIYNVELDRRTQYNPLNQINELQHILSTTEPSHDQTKSMLGSMLHLLGNMCMQMNEQQQLIRDLQSRPIGTNTATTSSTTLSSSTTTEPTTSTANKPSHIPPNRPSMAALFGSINGGAKNGLKSVGSNPPSTTTQQGNTTTSSSTRQGGLDLSQMSSLKLRSVERPNEKPQPKADEPTIAPWAQKLRPVARPQDQQPREQQQSTIAPVTLRPVNTLPQLNPVQRSNDINSTTVPSTNSLPLSNRPGFQNQFAVSQNELNRFQFKRTDTIPIKHEQETPQALRELKYFSSLRSTSTQGIFVYASPRTETKKRYETLENNDNKLSTSPQLLPKTNEINDVQQQQQQQEEAKVNEEKKQLQIIEDQKQITSALAQKYNWSSLVQHPELYQHPASQELMSPTINDKAKLIALNQSRLEQQKETIINNPISLSSKKKKSTKKSSQRSKIGGRKFTGGISVQEFQSNTTISTTTTSTSSTNNQITTTNTTVTTITNIQHESFDDFGDDSNDTTPIISQPSTPTKSSLSSQVPLPITPVQSPQQSLQQTSSIDDISLPVPQQDDFNSFDVESAVIQQSIEMEQEHEEAEVKVEEIVEEVVEIEQKQVQETIIEQQQSTIIEEELEPEEEEVQEIDIQPQQYTQQHSIYTTPKLQQLHQQFNQQSFISPMVQYRPIVPSYTPSRSSGTTPKLNFTTTVLQPLAKIAAPNPHRFDACKSPGLRPNTKTPSIRRSSSHRNNENMVTPHINNNSQINMMGTPIKQPLQIEQVNQSSITVGKKPFSRRK